MTESPTILPLPQGIRWVKLVCRLGNIISDLPEDPDAFPNHVAVSGEVTLSTSPNRITWQEEDGRWRSATIQNRRYSIRELDGELVDKEGRIGVWIPDPLSPGVEPSGFVVTATVIPANGDSWTVPLGGNTVLPDEVDLVRVAQNNQPTFIPQAPASQLALYVDSASSSASEAASSASSAAASSAAAASVREIVEDARDDAVAARTEIETLVADISLDTAIEDYLTANPPGSAPDATTAIKGLVQLAGDLGGTADAPTVPGLADKFPKAPYYGYTPFADEYAMGMKYDWGEGRAEQAMLDPWAFKVIAQDESLVIRVTTMGNEFQDTPGIHDGVGGNETFYGPDHIKVGNSRNILLFPPLPAGTSTVLKRRLAVEGHTHHADPQPINAQTATYSLVASDAGKLVTMTLAAAADLIVPANVFTAGQRVDLSDRGTARVTVVADSGMTVNPPPGGTLVMEGRYAYASLVFVSATEADLVGLVAGA